MIIWNGLGFLLPLTWVALATLAVAFDLNSYIPKPGSSALLLTGTGVLSGVYGFIIKKKAKNPKAHTFFFLKLEYWTIPLCLFSLYIYNMS